MCGIAGFIGDVISGKSPEDVITEMTDAIQHRGPDDEGYWIDREAKLVLGHRRLSILDLSAAGHQPMVSECGRFVIVFNGEIYNHLTIRKELEVECGVTWCGYSDTETLLVCFQLWGVERTLQSISGMFAIALWDRSKRCLSLARDRVGEKPLYYGVMNECFLFASEMSAIKKHPKFESEVDIGSLALLLRHNHIPEPYSIYSGIKKLEPGCYIDVQVTQKGCYKFGRVVQYWSYNKSAETGISNQFKGGYNEAVACLEDKLMQSVESQMLSDVPLGAFLSGGVDSSSIVAMMQAQSQLPVQTFTIGFDDKGYNEAESAKKIANHLGTHHTELYVTHEDALSVIPKLSSIYSEPFADSSQIPTVLLSELTGRYVKVALSGDGGDELFCGYNRYLAARSAWSRSRRLPICTRKALALVLNSLSPSSWDAIYRLSSPLLSNEYRMVAPGLKIQKLAEILPLNDEREFYLQLSSLWQEPGKALLNAQEFTTKITNKYAWPKVDCFEHSMMAMDAQTYLPGDILVKVDRAAMSVGLETRVPFLDPRMIEFSFTLPIGYKVKNGIGKSILRDMLYKHVPQKFIERPKQGFGIPLSDWLRGPLYEWAEDLLEKNNLHSQGFFNVEYVHRIWHEHLQGKRNWHHQIWCVLMFQNWLMYK